MQTRRSSFIEAAIGTAIGFVISIALSMVIYPAFGHAFSLVQNVWITPIFTAASIMRSYVVRRWFNARIQKLAGKINDTISTPMC